RYTLVTDGRSDKALKPILDWLLIDILDEQGIHIAIQGTWFDPSAIATGSLSEKVRKALELYPCELLFIHRDAEKQSRPQRLQEIHAATASLPPNPVPVIPVHMTEAWLLISEAALRAAACNRNGKAKLELPPLRYRCVHAITIAINDFSPLRQLPSFQALERDLRQWISSYAWPQEHTHC
ncbi:MAG: hypothetical protein ACKOZW_10775, partial [Cyanobium sp.]